MSETQSGEEVTQQHQDLAIRLQNARETEERFRAILEQRTGKLADVLAVEEGIARVRGEIEGMEAEQKALEHRVDFAAVEIRLSEEYKARIDVPDNSASTRLHNAFVAGYHNASETILGIVLFLEEFGPAISIWLVILALPVIGWRRFAAPLKIVKGLAYIFKNYSVRKALTGLMEAARWAGMMLATKAQIAERDDGAAEDERVPAFDLVELGRDEAGASDRDGNADEQADDDLGESSAQDEADDIGLVRAEGHADADFAGAALDGVGGDAVEADGGEDEGEDAEESGHLGDGALLIEVGIDLLLQGLNAEEGEVGIDVAEDVADRGFEALHAAVQLQDCAFDEVGAVVDGLHDLHPGNGRAARGARRTWHAEGRYW